MTKTLKIDETLLSRVIGCRSDFEVGGFLGDILVDGVKGLTSLRTAPDDLDSKAHRHELITAVRAGKHAELAVTARTFKQQKGKMNRRYLRLAGDLAEQVQTFAGQPFLLDHNTYEQVSRKGTILTSKLVEETLSRIAFEQSFNVVKPDAVISVLDGTLDRFSIGWFALGPVLCSLHGCDVRSLDWCGCWPGMSVKADGKMQIAEYVFTAWAGKETSGVNIPAVVGTSIDDIRAALAAELDFPTTRIRPTPKENEMRYPRLAAMLALAAQDELDEGQAVNAVEALQRRANAAEQERETLRSQLATRTTERDQAAAALTVATAAAGKIRIDAMLEQAYRDGKLGYRRVADSEEALPDKREARLRRIAGEKDGLAALEAELEEMEVSVPVGKRLQAESVKEPERREIGFGGGELDFADNPYIDSVARQLNLKPEDIIATERRLMQGGD